jgi:uncharacterized protein (DUF1501 family)
VFKGVLADHLRISTAALDRDAFPDSNGVRATQDLLRS